MEKEKRKTYSLAVSRSNELARASVDLTEQLGKTVPRQTILDALVECLSEKSVLNKVRGIIKKNI